MSTYIITYPKGFDEPGGGTKSYLQICQHLQKLGVDVIAVPVSSLKNGGANTQDFQVCPAPPNRYHYLLDSISVLRAVRDIESKVKIDAVISWEHEAAFLLDFLAERSIVYAMIAAYPSYSIRVTKESFLNPILKVSNFWFRWRLLRSADIVFVSSLFTQRELTDLVGVQKENTKLIYRGLDPVFGSVPRKSSDEIQNFVFYGSLAPVKGIFDAIKALGLIYRKGYQNWQLHVAGWGDVSALQESIAEHGLADNIRYLGSLSTDSLLHELEWADLAILPSRAESFGRSIAEAQSAGLAVISYDSGSVPELVIHGETGWLASPSNIDSLAQALEEAILNPQRTFEMGIQGRNRVNQFYSWDKTASLIHMGIQEKLNL